MSQEVGNLSADHASWYLSYNVARAKSELQASLDRLRGKTTIELDDAIDGISGGHP